MTAHFLEGFRDGNEYKQNKIAKIRRVTGLDPLAVIVKDQLSEVQAYELETFIIKSIGRLRTSYGRTGPLTNMTDGGEGCRNPDPSARRKQSEAASKPHSVERRDRRSEFSKEYNIVDNFGNPEGHWKGKNNPWFGQDTYGSKNQNAKDAYLLVDPNGLIMYVPKGEIHEDCDDRGLSRWAIRNSADKFRDTGKIYVVTRKDSTAKGWHAIRVPTVVSENLKDETMDNQQLSRLYNDIINGKFNDYPFGEYAQVGGSGGHLTEMR